MTTFASVSDLKTAIDTFQRRTYTQATFDVFIVLFEAWANRKLGFDYRRELAATLATDSNGEGTLPTGFLGMRSIVRDVVGSYPLTPVSWDALTSLNAYEVSDDAFNYAISGTALKVQPVTEDNFNIVYWSSITSLTGATSNWLLTAAPDAYFFGILAQAKLYHDDIATAAGLEQKARSIIEELRGQSDMAQYANAEMTLTGVTP